jgi:hypothetical protein
MCVEHTLYVESLYFLSCLPDLEYDLYVGFTQDYVNVSSKSN